MPRIKQLYTSILVFIASMVSLPIQAQSFITDENAMDDCGKQISVYQELMRMNYWTNAYTNWQRTYKKCTTNKKILLNDGDKILSELLLLKGKNKSKVLLDSLFFIYDKKSKLFENKDYYEIKKAFALYKFIEHTSENLSKIYHILENVQQNDTRNFPQQALFLKFVTASLLQKKSTFTEKQFISEFLNDYGYSIKQKNKALQKKLVAYYLRKGNIATMAIIKDLPDNYSLNNFSSLILLTVKMQWKTDSIKGKELAEKMLNDKLWQNKINASAKANLYLVYATNAYKAGRLKEAKVNAVKASAFQSTSANAYLLLGHIYRQTAYLKNPDFYSPALYCLAVDKYKKAINLNPNLSNNLDSIIKILHNYFPTAEDAFFHGLKAETKYHFGSWIQDETYVRFRH